MLIWAMFDCMYKLDQIRASWSKLEGAKEKKRGVGLGHLANWILGQKLQNSKLKNPVD